MSSNSEHCFEADLIFSCLLFVVVVSKNLCQ